MKPDNKYIVTKTNNMKTRIFFAVLSSLALVALFFIYPVFYQGYVKTYFPKEDSMGPFASFFGSLVLFAGALIGCVAQWIAIADLINK